MRLLPLALVLTVAMLAACATDPLVPPNEEEREAGLPAAVLRASHSTTCALTEDGRTWCWGRPAGTLSCDTDCATRPTAVAGAPAFSDLALGGSAFDLAACGLAAGGAPHCWGSLFVNLDGAAQLGAAPTPLANGIALESIAVGVGHICGVAPDGRAHCWGDYDGGRRGQATPTPGGVGTDFTPNVVSGGLAFRAVAAKFYGSCGIATDDRVHCWGAASDLGAPEAELRTDPDECGYARACRFEPIAVALDADFATLGARRARGMPCGVTTDGAAYCWGGDPFGDATPAALMRLALDHPVSQVVGGEEHTCALGRDGVALCWGANARGQLGTGGGSTETPTPVAGDTRFTELAAGGYHTCGRTTDGAVYCWGANDMGQIGVGTRTDATVPTRVTIEDS
jgi:alpha-tubulin suppressor-like RCC1 family protein